MEVCRGGRRAGGRREELGKGEGRHGRSKGAGQGVKAVRGEVASGQRKRRVLGQSGRMGAS